MPGMETGAVSLDILRWRQILMVYRVVAYCCCVAAYLSLSARQCAGGQFTGFLVYHASYSTVGAFSTFLIAWAEADAQ